MLSNAALDTGLLVPIVGLAVLLVVLVAARRASGKRELRTYCLSCGAPFQGLAPANFVGFREMKCPSCQRTELYPMTKALATTYVLVFTFACVSVIVRMIATPGWWPPLGGVWVLVLPIALVLHHLRWRKLREFAARAAEPFTPMRPVWEGQQRGGMVRGVPGGT